MGNFYVLDVSGQPVKEPDFKKAMKWHSNPENYVIWEDVIADGIRVRTEFLMIDHRFFGEGPPLLWETMIRGGVHGGNCKRHESREAAEKAHARAVELAKSGLN
jgi:hypothetical protein